MRDLWRRDQSRGLSAGEKRMLSKARQVLVGEIALAELGDKKKGEKILGEADKDLRAQREAAGLPTTDAEVKPDGTDVDLDDLSFDDEDA